MLRIEDRRDTLAICDQVGFITMNLYNRDKLQEHVELAMKPDVLPYGKVMVTVEAWNKAKRGRFDT